MIKCLFGKHTWPVSMLLLGVLVLPPPPPASAQADNTAPTLVSAVASGGSSTVGTTIWLTYDEDLDPDSLPAPTAFSLSVTVPASGNAAAYTTQLQLSSYDRSGFTTPRAAVIHRTINLRQVLLTVLPGSAINAGETVSLSYTPDASDGPIQDAAGNDAAALSNQTVTNNVTFTATDRPTPISAHSLGRSLKLKFDDYLQRDSVPAASDFEVKLTRSSTETTATIDSVFSITYRTVTLVLSAANETEMGDTLKISYTPGANLIRNDARVGAAAISDMAVTNVTPSGGVASLNYSTPAGGYNGYGGI